jgi:sarcosine/dimethylglycine N-methyltransferase
MTPATASSSAVRTARDYYNSDDADSFYSSIWGGEDIHIGLYESGEDSISDASRRTVARMASLLGDLNETTRVLDIGSGYGGSARFLARTYACHLVALNLSEVENKRARALNKEQGLDALIEVVDGSFEALPYPDGAFDVVWSQDAILHSGDRAQVLAEVARVMKPGGRFVFTDPMQADGCPDNVLQPILDRIHLDSLGSPGLYRKVAARVGLEQEDFIELTPQLVMHYCRVLQETEKLDDELAKQVSSGYIERMKKGLRHWIDGGEKGYLAWGIFRFRKA